eukprot:1490282-Prymnesium_polylepis.1
MPCVPPVLSPRPRCVRARPLRHERHARSTTHTRAPASPARRDRAACPTLRVRRRRPAPFSLSLALMEGSRRATRPLRAVPAYPRPETRPLTHARGEPSHPHTHARARARSVHSSITHTHTHTPPHARRLRAAAPLWARTAFPGLRRRPLRGTGCEPASSSTLLRTPIAPPRPARVRARDQGRPPLGTAVRPSARRGRRAQVVRRPVQLGDVDLQRILRRLGREMLLDDARRDGDHVLPLPVLDQVERVQRAHNVLHLDRAHLAELLDRDGAAVRLQDAQQHVRPVGAVAHHPQVGERPLRRAHLLLLA